MIHIRQNCITSACPSSRSAPRRYVIIYEAHRLVHDATVTKCAQSASIKSSLAHACIGWILAWRADERSVSLVVDHLRTGQSCRQLSRRTCSNRPTCTQKNKSPAHTLNQQPDQQAQGTHQQPKLPGRSSLTGTQL